MQTMILSMSAKDVAAVAAIEKRCFLDAWGEESVLATLSRKDFYGFCAVLDGEIVGYVCGTILFENAEVLRIAVLDTQRRKGIGAMLLDTFLSSANEQGAERVFLEVRAQNAAAIGLYASRGFENIRVREHYYAHGENAVEMIKTL